MSLLEFHKKKRVHLAIPLQGPSKLLTVRPKFDEGMGSCVLVKKGEIIKNERR